VTAAQPLRVGAAFPDPPFNGADGGGLDIALMSGIAGQLGVTAQFIPYDGADFNGIFDALNSGMFDCVASGTTVTAARQAMATFCTPYLVSGQSLAVDTARLPHVRSIHDLQGLTIGVQQGNTSQVIADRLVAQRQAARVRVYDYADIRTAITDLTTGQCDVVMKLAPVLTELVRPVPGVEVVEVGISTETIAIAVRTADTELLTSINAVQAGLEGSGLLGEMRKRWLGLSQRDQAGPPRR
jgi:polar amino acid transport system substrate-binding protein